MVNAARGEVEITFPHGSLTLCAELGRLAAWTHECDIQDINVLFYRLQPIFDGEGEAKRMIKGPDPYVVWTGLKHLAFSDDPETIIKSVRGPSQLGIAAAGLIEALAFEEEDDNENPPKAGAKG